MNGLTDNFLFSLFSLSFLAGIVMLLIPAKKRFLPQKVAFYLSLPITIVAIVAFVLFRTGSLPALFSSSVPFGVSLDLQICLGADNFSMMMILFAALFMPIAVLISRHAKRMDRFFYSCLFFAQTSLIGLFSAEDLFSFFFFWQMSAFPVFFFSGIWGRQNRISASSKFIVFHFLSSLLFFIGILYIAENAHYLTGKWSVAFKDIASAGLGREAQLYSFVFLASSFALRIPFFPFHKWFTSLVSENQPAGNIIMASLFVPSGLYAFIKIVIPLLPLGTTVFVPYLPYLLAAGCLYCSLMALAATSLSSMIAYLLSMNFTLVFLGIMSNIPASHWPAVYHISGISIIAAAIFSLTGALESRTKTVELSDIKSVSLSEPRFASMLLIAFFSMAGIPCFCGFAGIYGILSGMFATMPALSGLALSGIILSFISCMNALGRIIRFNRMEPASDSKKDNSLTRRGNDAALPMSDLNKNEFYVILPLSLLLIFAGMMPGLFSKTFLPEACEAIAGETNG